MNEHSAAAGFIERLGLAAEADGLPRIAGRLLGLLMLQDEALAFDSLVQQLRVSRASVSANTRLLEARGLIERSTKTGDRRDYFRIADDLHGRLLTRALERMRRMQSLASQFAGALPPEMNGARDRLRAMDRFYRIVVRSTESVLNEWYESGVEHELRETTAAPAASALAGTNNR